MQSGYSWKRIAINKSLLSLIYCAAASCGCAIFLFSAVRSCSFRLFVFSSSAVSFKNGIWLCALWWCLLMTVFFASSRLFLLFLGVKNGNFAVF